jgi:hypothetical protein
MLKKKKQYRTSKCKIITDLTAEWRQKEIEERDELVKSISKSRDMQEKRKEALHTLEFKAQNLPRECPRRTAVEEEMLKKKALIRKRELVLLKKEEKFQELTQEN